MNLSSVLGTLSWPDLFSWFLRVTLITVTGLLVLVLLRRASASTRHLVAMAALLCVVALVPAGALLPSVTLPILPATQPSSSVANPAPEWAERGSTHPAPVLDIAPIPSAVRAGFGMTFPLFALLLVALVAAALLVHFFISLLAAWSTVRRARRIEDPLLRGELSAACERLGTPRDMDLRESPSVTVPVVWGTARPVLLLPVEARQWTREQLRVVFLHEGAHVARRDWVSLLLARLTTSLFWFHPLVWKLARTAQQECERSCDDLVLASGERPADYAGHLLAIVRSMTPPAALAGMAPPFAHRSNLENRLAAILRARQVRGSISRSRFVVTIAAAVLLLVGTAAVRVVAAQRPAGRAADAVEVAASEARIDAGAPRADVETTQGERWFRSGRQAFEARRYVRAASSYLAAAEIGYRRPESLYQAARALANAGASDQALETLQAAVDAGFDRTESLSSDGSFDAIRSCPRFLALQNRKVALMPQPTAPSVMAQPVVAEPIMAQPILAQPVMAQPWASSSAVSRVYVSTGSRKSDEQGESGIELMRAGQYDRAIHAFNEEIRETGSSNARYNLACAYALRGSKAEAFGALEDAIENGFGNAHHMTEDDDLKLLQGDPRFYRLVRLTQDLQLFRNGHFGFNDKDDWRKALPRLERVANEHPKVGIAWANLGYGRLEAGDPKGATEAYRRALDAGYRQPLIMYNLACCAARSGDLDEAFRWLERADKAGFEVGEYMSGDSDLDALRADRRFAALLERSDERQAKEHREKEKSSERDKSY